MASDNISPPTDDPENWSRLMQQAQAGDAAAYRRLLNEMTPVLKRFLRSRFFAKDHVDDIAQEILLAIHAARHTYRPEQPFRNWMYGLARHKMIDYMRRQTRKNAHEKDDADFETFIADGANSPEEALAGKDVERALQQLPDKQRQILLMTKVQGYSMAETGQKLGMSEVAVKVAAHRAYKKMKEWLVSYGY